MSRDTICTKIDTLLTCVLRFSKLIAVLAHYTWLTGACDFDVIEIVVYFLV